ncbi:beta-eliminating lyase-related protein [Metabacillus sp. GX 13764]|uniref:threonine aldolase family protein n=1 Tax=Metabacillus kandeliae TaxID=2900151 RepID=UPI001E30470B|nr:beta-eliminating lyase-related protein [Metabacillus kandeliae]MCD7033624.1 beta-eliminating lyase-related protein [Metabacillus kandeliae]
MSTLLNSFHETKYQLTGHGKRDIQTLLKAFQTIDPKLESDKYGQGKVIEEFQNKLSTYLGKESAVFFPSGTMAQQIALRIWCDQKGEKTVAYHPLCHLEIHEEEGLKELHHIHSLLLADKDRLIELEDVMTLPDHVACLLLELPQREIGGQLPPYETIEAISSYCRKKGIKLHLDGARLFEILPFYRRTAEEICRLFDSVYVSFYKGLGGIAGAVLAGDHSFIEKSKVWKRRHGGDLISLYPYIISSDYYFEKRKDRMEQYYQDAVELAELYNQCSAAATIPVIPVSNMFHVHFQLSKKQLEPILTEIYRETGVGLTGYLAETGEHSCSYEVSIGDQYGKVPKEKLKWVFQLINENLHQ